MTGTLREVFDDLASEVRPVDLTDRVHQGVRRRRHRRNVALAATSAGLVLAGVVVVTRPGPDTTETVTPPTTSASATASATEAPVAEPPLYDVVWSSLRGYALTWHARDVDGRVDDFEDDMPLGVFSGDLSPDGRRLAYAGYRGIEVLTLDGAKPAAHDVPRTAKHALAQSVVWSPDGRTFAVVDEKSIDGRTGVSDGFYLVDATTGLDIRIAHSHRNFGLAWSPDGTQLALVSPDGTVDILAKDGTVVRRLEFDTFPRLASDYAWSPDGTRLLLQLNGDEPAKAYTAVVSVTTGAELFRLDPPRPYVWRGDAHVACQCTDGVVTERTLAGIVTRTLARADGPVMQVMIRPS